MKAMILAAGLGTRLKPWTLEHPKALVPVDGVPMLERVILKLKGAGFNEIIINTHHFSDQIMDFLSSKDFGVKIIISDETMELLDTGGGIAKCSEFIGAESVLVHNVDILSNVDLGLLMQTHNDNKNDVTLLTSDRDSSRKLIFDSQGNLKGWHNVISDEYKPCKAKNFIDVQEEAFSGIYIMGTRGMDAIKDYRKRLGKDKFPIMDFFLSLLDRLCIKRIKMDKPVILDIGKPESLAKAGEILKQIDKNID